MKKLNTIKIATCVVSVAFGSFALTAFAVDSDDIQDWQSPMANDFSKLDTSGNGLLLPLEASKDKSFNKRTFKRADTDADGTIDQEEYIKFKTGTVDSNEKPANSSSNPMDVKVADSSTDMPSTSAEPPKRTAGAVIDDSMITTKSKAVILKTPDLKSLQISVTTLDGEVTLSGAVDNEAAKMKVEEVIKKVKGVKSVVNNLEIKTN
jgi:hyperosmotically inducible periplasmic protein